jgi:hypothetical protein
MEVIAGLGFEFVCSFVKWRMCLILGRNLQLTADSLHSSRPPPQHALLLKKISKLK